MYLTCLHKSVETLYNTHLTRSEANRDRKVFSRQLSTAESMHVLSKLHPIISTYDTFHGILQCLNNLTALKLFNCSRSLRNLRRMELSKALEDFIRPFLPARHTLTMMRATYAFLFNVSSYAFIFEDRHKWTAFKTLFLMVPRDSYEIVEHYISGNGYREYKTASAEYELTSHFYEHLSTMSHLSAIVIFQREGHRIVVAIAAKPCVFRTAVSTTTTAFMNIVGPDSLWSAYPLPTQAHYSLRNPASYETISNHFNILTQSKVISRHCDFREYDARSRLSNEKLHNTLCEKKYGNEQLRASADRSTLFIYFAADANLISEDEQRKKESFEGTSLIWVLGGECCDGERSRVPLITEVEHLYEIT